MPWTVTLRSTETVEIDLPETDSIAERDAAIAERLPERFELVNLRPSERKAFARSRVTQTVKIGEREELWTCAPEGWQALTLRES
ncbi:hypothetical protein [Microbacterium sp. gxy059]|uniref:hypothetical protein n=1 Tax=Microbacterium sp. gxy059 TaxID=2957199 RepID=UPI003D9572FE